MKKILIAWMLLLVMVFAVACGTDKKKDDGILPDPTADVIPDSSVDPDGNNNGTAPDSGTAAPDNGNDILPDDNGAGENGAGQNDASDPDATVIPELVPSEQPDASANSEQAQK